MTKYLEVLKSVALFEGIDKSDIQSLLSCLSGQIVHYGKNLPVFMNGEYTANFGIVLSGQVQIVNEDYYGNRSIIAKVDEGNLFGEAFACADIKKLPVSVFAATESDILFIDCRRLISPCTNVCAFHSRLIYNMMRIIAVKNIMLTRKIEFTSKRTTREKLFAYLSSEAKKAGSNIFTIPFNRQELADYLSVDRSAMSAELSKMREDGILKFDKSRFELFQ